MSRGVDNFLYIDAGLIHSPPLMSATTTVKRPLHSLSSESPEPPAKRARMSLRRTNSYLSLSDLPNQKDTTTGSLYITASKELRQTVERSIAAALLPITNPAPLRKSRSPSRSPSRTQTPPASFSLPPQTPPQPSYPSCTQPRSRPRRFPREPDLHRQAIQRCMRATSEGQKILNMGPRLAVGILNATRELERLLLEGELRDRSATTEDVVMEDWEVVNH